MRELRFDGTFAGWRTVARAALGASLPPADVVWRTDDDAQSSLLACADDLVRASAATVAVPRAFFALAADVSCHRDASRWDTLYRALWRITHGERELLQVYVDDDVHRLFAMSKAVRREGHKLRAFVRFRRVEDDEGERYVAWFEPEQDVVEREAPFFARRFPAMRWSILTPRVAAHWDGASVRFLPGVPRACAPEGDALEALWRTYYASTFNPARPKPKMMRSEMPVRYWKYLPEASLIAPLLRDAPGRVRSMIAARGAAIPADLSRAIRADSPVVDAGISGARARSAAARMRSAEFGFPGGSCIDGANVLAGTASWTDPTMTAAGVFYPVDVRSAEGRLAYYASQHSLVEVDATYYAMPSARVAALWAERTPAGFVFDVKAHALMTGHATSVARLPADIREALPGALRGAREVRTRELPSELVNVIWERFLAALEPLRTAGKLGALLLQMPRDFTPSSANEAAIAALRERAGDEVCAVELRHASWVTDAARRERTLDLLRAHDLAFVMVDAPPGFETSMPAMTAVTSERLAMVRMHGRRRETWERPVEVVSERYRYLYDAAELTEWVPRIIDVAQRTQGVHVVMNNCHSNYGTCGVDEITAMLVEADAERRRMYRERRVIVD
ncbi:MAG: TIGR03915 family putative DNA repair protein [Gemmatimonadaceae bacterium]